MFQLTLEPPSLSALNMIRVFSSPVAAIAHIVKTMLSSAGLYAEIRNEDRTQLAGGIPVDHCLVEVWVQKTDEDTALKLIEEIFGDASSGQLSIVEDDIHLGALSTSHEWTCQRCKSLNPPNFELCWSCNTAR